MWMYVSQVGKEGRKEATDPPDKGINSSYFLSIHHESTQDTALVIYDRTSGFTLDAARR